MNVKRKDREEFWRSVLAKQKRSGLTVYRFCQQERVSEASFYNWRKRLNGSTPGQTSDAPSTNLVPVRITPPTQQPNTAGSLPQDRGLTLSSPTGWQVQIPNSQTSWVLGRLLDQLSGTGVAESASSPERRTC